MAVRSQQLAVGTAVAAGTTTLLTVPAGHRYIIKSVMVMNPSAGADGAVRLGTTFPAGTFTIYKFPSIPADTSAVLELWWVLNPGDVLTITHTVAAFRWLVSGADLVE